MGVAVTREMGTFAWMQIVTYMRCPPSDLEPRFAMAGLSVGHPARRDGSCLRPSMIVAAMDPGPRSSEPSMWRGTQVPDDPSLSICLLAPEDAQLTHDCLDALRVLERVLRGLSSSWWPTALRRITSPA